jgi:hypothetical protein
MEGGYAISMKTPIPLSLGNGPPLAEYEKVPDIAELKTTDMLLRKPATGALVAVVIPVARTGPVFVNV